MTEIDPQRTLATLVEERPACARAFESFDLDYCCNGDRTLVVACAEADVDVADVVAEVEGTHRQGTPRDHEWESPSDLVDHVVASHHDFLREELPKLAELVGKVRRVHGEAHPELRELEETFGDLAGEMYDHIEEEETELFPVVGKLERGEPLDAVEATRLREGIEGFEDDHAATAARLDRIADLTDGYAAPEDTCASYRSMLDRLEALERDMHMHVHKENNVLFPAVESRLGAEG